MKKILITLAVIAALTACSSTQEVQDTKDINADLAVNEQVVDAEPTLLPEINEVITEEIAAPVVEDTMRTLYSKDGVVITAENNEITLVMPSDVVFDFDRIAIKDEFKPMLDLMGDALKANPNLTATITGHTDSIGQKDYNQRLSVLRADEAKNYLVTEGVEAERLTTTGYGLEKPVASNDTAEGRERNRRIEITLTK